MYELRLYVKYQRAPLKFISHKILIPYTAKYAVYEDWNVGQIISESYDNLCLSQTGPWWYDAIIAFWIEALQVNYASGAPKSIPVPLPQRVSD